MDKILMIQMLAHINILILQWIFIINNLGIVLELFIPLTLQVAILFGSLYLGFKTSHNAPKEKS